MSFLDATWPQVLCLKTPWGLNTFAATDWQYFFERERHPVLKQVAISSDFKSFLLFLAVHHTPSFHILWWHHVDQDSRSWLRQYDSAMCRAVPSERQEGFRGRKGVAAVESSISEGWETYCTNFVRVRILVSMLWSLVLCSQMHLTIQSSTQQFLVLVLTSHEFCSCFWHLGFSQAPGDLTPADRPVEELFCCEKGEETMHGKMELKDATVSHCSCCFFFVSFECDRLSKKPIAFWKKDYESHLREHSQ